MITEINNDPVGAKTLNLISRADRFNQWIYDIIKPFLKGDIFEAGSGIGNISKFIIKDQYSITLSDINENYCTYLKKNYGRFQNVKDIISIDFQHPEYQINYEGYKNRFDTIILLNVIEHLEDDNRAVSICNYMLKANGHLIILAPSYPFLFCNLDKELGHYRRYTLKQLSKVIEGNKFCLLQKTYFNFLGIAGWLVSGKILQKGILGKNEMSVFDKFVPLAKLFDKLILNKAGLSAIVFAKKC
jgi:2-polyprenyl-3-methyl-5-hydroxy-6-metoxy-1,4-benzoquinol methylase